VARERYDRGQRHSTSRAGLADALGRTARSCSWADRVGKTELCKALAEFLSTPRRRYRIDMSEFMEKHPWRA